MNKKAFIIIAAAALALFAVSLRVFSRVSCPLSKAQSPVQPGVQSLLAQARGFEGEGKLLEAKAVFQKLVSEFPNHRDVAQWQRNAEQLFMKLIFSSVATPQTVQYEVKPGDSLEKIAREYKTTVELIVKSNAIQDERKIYPGMKIRVWKAPFTILVDKSSNILLLKCDEEVVKTYVVATGANNSTPVGTFRIIEKIVNPPWYKDGKVIPPTSPENILGTRWLGIDKEGYGIHGTTEPQSLGKQATAGCVRMANQEVEELFSIVPQGTVVTIVD